ncbi:MAG TPA: type II toxin-antitoxin system HicB family antitoxin [Chloroflexia bacterium]|nr:type II toxin-antitoxin system HicB family antitoxin [Chloroflexia bacterium]
MREHEYPIEIFYSEEDGGYIANIPDLKYCSAFGDTPEEALRELELAKAAWIESAQALGKPIPQPSRRSIASTAAP